MPWNKELASKPLMMHDVLVLVNAKLQAISLCGKISFIKGPKWFAKAKRRLCCTRALASFISALVVCMQREYAEWITLYSSSHTLTLFSSDITACENCVIGVVDCINLMLHWCWVVSMYRVTSFFPWRLQEMSFRQRLEWNACGLPFAGATQGHFIRSTLNLLWQFYVTLFSGFLGYCKKVMVPVAMFYVQKIKAPACFNRSSWFLYHKKA